MLMLLFMPYFWLVPILAYNVPGTSPKDYSSGDNVMLTTNSLGNNWSRWGGVSYDYYSKRFNFCRPADGIHQLEGNLGSLLFGDRIYDTPFQFKMLQDVQCAQLCTNHYSQKRLGNLRMAASRLSYFWNIDDLPLVYEEKGISGDDDDDDDDEDDYSHGWRNRYRYYQGSGVPLGRTNFFGHESVQNFYNHFDFTIEYHEHSPGQYRVVGARVTPTSKNYNTTEDARDCNANTSINLSTFRKGQHAVGEIPRVSMDTENNEMDITYTYSVTWKQSNIKWASRWDKYLQVKGSDIHWAPLVSSLVIVGIICIALNRVAIYSVRKDIANIRQSEYNPNIDISSGWKLLKDSCLRAPKNTLLLSVLVGNGSHLFFLAFMTILFAALGFLSPERRGYLATVAIYIYSFSSIIAGYVAAYSFKSFKGEDYLSKDDSENTVVKTDLTLWSMLFVLTPIFVPGIVFGTVLLLNFLVIFQGSSGAVPFAVILKLIALWFFVSIPFSLIGSFIGKRRRTDYTKLGTAVSDKPLPKIPTLPFYLKPIVRTLLSGLLPFIAISVELVFIMSSLWLHQIYYMFGFLFASYMMMVITSVTVTIGIVYLMLLAGDYRWQWSSFALSGSVGIYVFLSSIGLLFFRYSYGGLTAILLYLSYSFLISGTIFLLTGSIGFLSTWIFIRGIYSAVRID